jgi:hypothetical protein
VVRPSASLCPFVTPSTTGESVAMHASHTPRRLILAAFACATGYALAPTAAAIPFGADLNRPATSTVDCTILPSGTFGFPTNVPNCTWTALGRLGDFSEGLNVPAGRGTITAVRVRVGPTTGPMQAIVFRSLRDPNSTAQPVCCQVQSLSTVFTPAPNAVTTVQVNFPVVNDRVVEPGLLALRFDTLALSVLALGVPIPAHNTGNFDPLTAQGGLGFYPAFSRLGEERVGPAGLAGYQLLVQGEWVPTPEGATPPPVGVSPVAIRLVQPVVSIAGPTASVGLVCGPAAPCAGIVRLQSQPVRVGASEQARSHATKPRLVTYASSRFSLAPGEQRRVSAKLTSVGRKIPGTKSATRAWLNVTVGGKPFASTRVTLRWK